MAIVGLHHLNIRVPANELVALQTFYTEVVGLRLGPRPPFQSVGAWLYAGSKPILHLSQMNTGETLAPGSPISLPESLEDRRSAFDHIALACVDLDDTEARLKRHGIRYTRTEVPSSGDIQLFLRDPSGVAVELVFPGSAESGVLAGRA